LGSSGESLSSFGVILLKAREVELVIGAAVKVAGRTAALTEARVACLRRMFARNIVMFL
jgi:hypothetical protein